MSVGARWVVAVTAAVAGFAGGGALAVAVGLNLGLALAVAAVPFTITLAVLGPWAERAHAERRDHPVEPSEKAALHWAAVPQGAAFHGRRPELSTLRQWVDGGCEVILIQGMPGAGKTSIAAQLARELSAGFAVAWYSLLNAPPIEDLLADAVRFVSGQRQLDLPADADGRIALLVEQMAATRCLIVLDNFDTVLAGKDRPEEYLPGYAAYGRLLRSVSETAHRSCLVVTSRERPGNLTFPGRRGPARHFELGGLSEEDAEWLLGHSGVSGSDADLAALVSKSGGNPLILKQAAQTVSEIYQGDLAVFLRDWPDLAPDVYRLLTPAFERLSALDQSAMFWLAVNREAVSLPELHDDMLKQPSRQSLFEALEALSRRSMIEAVGSGLFGLQPVIMEFVTERLIDTVCAEVQAAQPAVLATHALLKAQAKTYIRAAQVSLVLTPVAERLLGAMGRTGLKRQIDQMLDTLRNQGVSATGYAAGNLCNLLVRLEYDLRGADFAGLTLLQALLQGVSLVDATFAHAHLVDCLFSEDFGTVMCAAVSSDGLTIATGTLNGEIRIWDADSGRPRKSWTAHADRVWEIAFSPDGTTLASCSEDETIRLWELPDATLLKELRGHTHWIPSIAYSPDGTRLASAAADETARVWDVANGTCLKELRGHTGWVMSVCFAPAGDQIATAGADGTVRLWDAITGECKITMPGHAGPAGSLTFSADGTLLASSGADDTVRI